MRHRFAQILLITAGIGFLLVPFLSSRANGSMTATRLTAGFLVQLLLALACFYASVIAGRNARKRHY